MEILKKVSSLYHKLLFQISNNCTVFVRYSLWLFLDKMNLSKPGPKPSKKLFDTTNYVFKEVDMNSVKSVSYIVNSLKKLYSVLWEPCIIIRDHTYIT